MKHTISNREAYITLFKLLSLEEQKAVYQTISELLEDVEDAQLLEERKDEEKTSFNGFLDELANDNLYEKL